MKKYYIKVIPHAKVEQIQVGLDSSLKVWLREKPLEGKANNALISIIANYLKVSKRSVRIVKGEKNRSKIVEIDG
ncbi:MAG: DUF167 domain-containing protein [Patescibacteria group bacterium]